MTLLASDRGCDGKCETILAFSGVPTYKSHRIEHVNALWQISLLSPSLRSDSTNDRLVHYICRWKMGGGWLTFHCSPALMPGSLNCFWAKFSFSHTLFFFSSIATPLKLLHLPRPPSPPSPSKTSTSVKSLTKGKACDTLFFCEQESLIFASDFTPRWVWDLKWEDFWRHFEKSRRTNLKSNANFVTI